MLVLSYLRINTTAGTENHASARQVRSLCTVMVVVMMMVVMVGRVRSGVPPMRRANDAVDAAHHTRDRSGSGADTRADRATHDAADRARRTITCRGTLLSSADESLRHRPRAGKTESNKRSHDKYKFLHRIIS